MSLTIFFAKQNVIGTNKLTTHKVQIKKNTTIWYNVLKVTAIKL
jgi:hypothetical protein